VHSASTIASGVNSTRTPSASAALPKIEFGPYRTRIMTPHTSVGIASGRSTTVDKMRRPGNRYRTMTHASVVPITALIAATIVAVTSVSWIAAHAPGAAIACVKVENPSPNPFVTIAATGSTTRAPR
jgi:hypothetical protein